MDVTDKQEKYVLSECRRLTPMISRLGDKWTVLVIVSLRDGPRRFNAIKREIEGISQQMLTRTLKSLERDGMVTRTIFATNPPQVQYELTPLGTSLSVPVLALGKWVHEHMAEIDLARAKFDRKEEMASLRDIA